ncbi:hypothetical protein, partial [Streptomyces formicae]
VRVLGADVTVVTEWEPFSGFKLDEINLWFTAGFGGPIRIDGGMEARCIISDELILTASARFPDNRLEIHVKDTLDLEGVNVDGSVPLPEFDSDLSTGGQPIVLENLSMVCSLSRPREFSLDLALETDLSAPPWFSLSGVKLSVNNNEGSETEFSFQGEAECFGVTALVAVNRGADGWSIRGELELPEGMTFSQWVSEQFDYTLPAALSSLEIDLISLSYSSALKEVSFDCAGSMAFAGVPCEFHIYLQKSPDGMNVEGRLALYPVVEDVTLTMELALLLEKDPSSKTLAASWVTDGEGIPVLAVLESLDVVPEDVLDILPDEVWPVARAVSVAYDSATGGFGMVIATERVGVVAVSEVPSG